VGYLTGLAKRGYTIGMDHMPMGLRPPSSGLVPWQKRAATVKQLIDAGYGDRIFLSNDWYFGVSIAATGAMNAMEQLNPEGMLFTARKTIPYLRELGVSGAAIRTITVDNPRRFLSGT
jgi:predicted metal-dependent phosphotriesterase family hydrolase